ncbi:MAG: lytic transglycosylase domain-containing protein [Candidatus Tectomicrobia bacterium]|uniref:Lytic transglycosylase domain-containing protein n=1 Tax=Tectimicrobiota bacterium TaxID=2528274 RepID=A0A932FXT4_UNCTE|nr:lytic transglycosylase domain-containing protein [Candidatus Tectomicrobia bacterium]
MRSTTCILVLFVGLLFPAIGLAAVRGEVEDGERSTAARSMAPEAISSEAIIAEAQKHFVAGGEHLLKKELEEAAREYQLGLAILAPAVQSHPEDRQLQRVYQHWQAVMNRVSRITALNLLGPERKEAPLESSTRKGLPKRRGEAPSLGEEGEEAEEEVAETVQETILDHLPKLKDFPANLSRELREQVSAKARSARYQVPLMLAPGVLQVIHFYQSTPTGRKIMAYGLRHQGLYREIMAQTLLKEGLPGDLISLAQVESNFWPRAISPAGAVGLWQFMEETGARYGLRRNGWIDERRDPAKSTRAAARYLKDLYRRFGDWYLALAAYNAGENRVEAAMAAGKSRDYWLLCRKGLLPPETRNFVPIFLATMMILEDPAYFGFEAKPLSPPGYQEVKVPFSVNVRKLAELAKIDPKPLYQLNPELNDSTTPPGASPYLLRVPPGTAAQIKKQLSQLRLAASNGSRTGTPAKSGASSRPVTLKRMPTSLHLSGPVLLR